MLSQKQTGDVTETKSIYITVYGLKQICYEANITSTIKHILFIIISF